MQLSHLAVEFVHPRLEVEDDEALHPDAHGDDAHDEAEARRLGLVIALDHSADGEARAHPRQRERRVEMVAADIVEIDVDAFGRGRGETLQDRLRLVVDDRGRRRASGRTRTSPRRPPSRSRVMPLALAIWTTAEPTAPAAAETNTMSPSLAAGDVEQAEIGGRAGHAEIAEESLRLRRRGSGSLLSGARVKHRFVAPAGHVEHMVAGREAVRLATSTTSPTAPPSIGWSIWNGGT